MRSGTVRPEAVSDDAAHPEARLNGTVLPEIVLCYSCSVRQIQLLSNGPCYVQHADNITVSTFIAGYATEWTFNVR